MDMSSQPIVLPRLDVVCPLDPEVQTACYIDIVAVHGILERDYTQSWTTLDSWKQRVSWLSDNNMLPSAISHLRVLHFSYDPSAGREGLRVHLERTSSRLKELVHEQILRVEHRPIIFVAHGYGGLIVLKALIAQNLSERTAGVVFLATPFRIEEKSLALPSFPWSARSIDEPAVLRDLLLEFRSSPHAKTIQMRCFYESQTTTELYGQPVPNGFVVPRAEAVLGDPNSMAFALDVNHQNINKFSGPLDHNYELVSDVLQGLVDRTFPQRLAQAIAIGDEDTTMILISQHSGSIATDERMGSALAASISKGSLKTLKLLLAYHINVNLPLNQQKDTALILAVRSAQRNRSDIVRLLLEKGADVSAQNTARKTALDVAKAGKLVDVETLLEERPPLVGPRLKRTTLDGDKLRRPKEMIESFGSAAAFHGRIADVYEYGGRERTFLKMPSCHDLIYEHGPRHLMNRATSKETESGEKKFRWLHIPANNLVWMKDLIQRTYYERYPENSADEDYFFQKCGNILDPSLWESQVVTSPIGSLSHIRYLAPRCRILSYLRDPAKIGVQIPSVDMIFSMPFLHYEEFSKREAMAATINQIRRVSRRHPNRPSENSPDQNLIWAYMRGEMSLHCRRTLDQFYYDSLDSDVPQMANLTPRNSDQVVQRFMEAQEKWKGEDPHVLMVDQIWMVLLEDDTLITSFPQRWGHTQLNEGNASKLADFAGIISKELSNEFRQPLTSAYDMILLILDTITNAMFSSSTHRNEKLQFFEFFERKIQEVTNSEAELFGHLKYQLSRHPERSDDTLRNLLDELLDISTEVDLINEIKDIHDELVMIDTILTHQTGVLEQMEDLFAYRDPESGVRLSPQTINKYNKIVESVEQRRLKIAKMEANAHRTHKSLNNLFDLKQKQANVLEAHYARKVAQDSGRQSTTLMIFTVVTIIFLPLSFMSSFYALSVKEFPRDPRNQNQLYMSLHYVVSRVLGFGLGTAVIIVGLGFLVNWFIVVFPEVRNKQAPASRSIPSASSNLNEEHKVFTAERTPLRETASVITWTSYTPKSTSRTSTHLSQILRFSRQNIEEEKAARSATV